MDISSPFQKTNSLLALFGLSFVVFGWFSLSLALGSLFLFPLVLSGVILSGIITLLIAIKLLTKAPLDIRIACIISVLAAILIGLTTEPSLLSGRDQGSISEAAYRLAKNGQLAFSMPASETFFEIYGPGRALNFPGFAYLQTGDLITEFPLGYTAWLAGFVSLFDLAGFAVANAILFFLFLFSFYALLRLFVHPLYAFFGLALALFSFLPAWFARFTLTENLAVFLFTFLLFNLISFLREGKFVYYAGILLTGGLYAFTRLEGFIFLALVFILLFFSAQARTIWKTYPWKSLVIPAILFVFVMLRDFFLNVPYYKNIAKALVRLFNGLSGSGTVQAGVLNGSDPTLALGSIFFLYGLFLIFLLGFFGFLIFLKERRYEALIPAFIAFPTLLYLFAPNITLDHPWMLRRYLFSLFPTFLFSAIVGMALLFARDRSHPFPLPLPVSKRLIFISLIFLSMGVLAYPAWKLNALHPDGSARDQIAAFSQYFSERDLILVDRLATGSGFSMLTGPSQYLHGLNAVYFFNPQDLEHIDVERYERVFLLVPIDTRERYFTAFGDRLTFVSNVQFRLSQFEDIELKRHSKLRLPTWQTIETTNALYQIR